MATSLRRSASVWTLTVILLILLPLLAVLQYSWLDRLSDWERERMQYILRTGTENFRAEFDTRVEPVFRTFQLLFAPTSPEGLPHQFRSACDRIEEKLGDDLPPLIADMYWSTPAGVDRSLYHYDIATDSLAAIAWPSPSDPLLSLLETLPVAPRLPIDRIPVLWVDGSPFLVIPDRQSAAPGGTAWVLIRLDATYLRDELFPALIDRHFGDEQAPRFDVAVIAETIPPEALFLSRATLSATDFAECDAAAELFQLEQALFMVVQAPGTDAPTAPPALDVSAPPNESVALATVWSVRVRHVGGSLERALISARRRNLLVAFSILVLLGVSVMLLIFTTQRARKLARLRLAFIGGVSHELRSPLAVITSAAENLADAVVSTPEQTRMYGDLIRREGRRLQGMVDRVIRFARYQSGTAEYELSPQRLSPVLEAACNACSPELKAEDCSLTRSLADNLPLVTINADAIDSAVANLLGNAIKHGGPGREIEIKADLQTLHGQTEVRISVRDTGPGIAPGELEMIFEPFRRTAATREAQVPGSGLGLSLVREIMRAHGGHCEARNLDGGGCVFTLHLPLRGGAGGHQEME